MHEFEDLVEQSVRCLEASERPGLDHRSLFKQLYAFQEQYDTGYTHGRVLDILEKHRFTYSFPVDAHPDFVTLGPKFPTNGWLHAKPGEEWDAEMNPALAFVRDSKMYFDAGGPLWRRFVSLGRLDGRDGEAPHETSMDDVAATVVEEAACQGKRDLIKAWLALFAFSQSEGVPSTPGLKRMLVVAQRLKLFADEYEGRPLAQLGQRWASEPVIDSDLSTHDGCAALESALHARLPALAPEAIAALLRELPAAVADVLAEHSSLKLPGLVELRAKVTPGTKGRTGMNPFTKERMELPGRPTVVEAHAYPEESLREAIATRVKAESGG